MGEYAKFNGGEIKVGTCENMYYIRADQRHLVEYDFDAGDRFRFPFPDEDAIEPGQFGDHDRGVEIPGYTISEGHDHGTVQFVASVGYVVSLPCPEQYGQPGFTIEMPDGLRVGRNGFHGYPVVKQQKVVDGALWTVIACGACGYKWRLPKDQAAEVAERFLDEAEREEYRHDLGGFGPAHTDDSKRFYLEMAKRIMAGYEAVAHTIYRVSDVQAAEPDELDPPAGVWLEFDPEKDSMGLDRVAISASTREDLLAYVRDTWGDDDATGGWYSEWIVARVEEVEPTKVVG